MRTRPLGGGAGLGRPVVLTAMIGSVLGGLMVAPAASAAPVIPPPVTAPPRAWILVDADSGTVLSAGNDHEALPPASTAKLMTALVAIEKLPLDGSVLVSQNAADQPAMKITMHAGERWPIADAMRSLLIVSANDAAYALAEAASGTVEQFAKDAAATGRRLGMQDSVWNDPAGLDDQFATNGSSMASAFDLAIAARNVLAVPELAAIAKLPEYRFTGPDGHGHVLRNHDRLLGRYVGAVGLKTGYTRKAGNTLVAAANRNGRTMIAVVLAADDMYGAAGGLLDQGFSTPADAPGTGEHLPAVKVSPTGAVTGGHAPAKPTFLPADKSSVRVTNHRSHRVRNATLVLVVVGVAFVARRRQITRRRARRAARRRAAIEAREYAVDRSPDTIHGARLESHAADGSGAFDDFGDFEVELPDFGRPTVRRVPGVAPIPVVDLSDLTVADFDFDHELEDELAARRRERGLDPDRSMRRGQA